MDILLMMTGTTEALPCCSSWLFDQVTLLDVLLLVNSVDLEASGPGFDSLWSLVPIWQLVPGLCVDHLGS